MIHNKKEFTGGIALLVVFFAVLVVMFMPIFNGHNAMAYLDNLFNSISKGSAYYVPRMQEAIKPLQGQTVKVSMELESESMAAEGVALIQGAGATASAEGKTLTIEGDYGAILASCVSDADKMYNNDGAALKARYPVFADAKDRQPLYDWYNILKGFDKGLKKQKAFEQAKIAVDINSKVVETAYNYYRVVPEKVADKMGILIFALAFYVVYTMWYGFGIMFTFEGWGLKIGGH